MSRTRFDVVCVLALAGAFALVGGLAGSASGLMCPDASAGGTCGGGGDGTTYVTDVSVASPSANASVSGTVTLTANVSATTSGGGGGCTTICVAAGPAGTSSASGGTGATLVGAGVSVSFYVDGVLVGSAYGSPYSVSWNTLDPNQPFYDGSHTITVWAYASNAMESQPVTFNVANTAGTQYQATYSTTAVPEAMLDGTSGTKYPEDVTVKNTSSSTWSSKYVTMHYRWYSPDPTPTVIDGGALPLTSNVGAGGSFTFHPSETPPTLPSGVDRASWKLRFDLYDSRNNVWFSDKGNQPLDNPVIVNHSLSDALGLERYYHYVGEDVGAGMTHLVNVANGNSLLHWTPLDEPGKGLATVMDITYNTLEQKSDSPLGNNFSLAISTLSRFGLPIDIHPNKADSIAGRSNRWISFIDGDGTPHRFDGHVAADGTVYWTEPPGVHLYLHSTANGYAFTRPDGVTFNYDSSGFPVNVTDRNGNTITYTWTTPASPADDPGKIGKNLTAVTDAGGRSFNIAYYTKDTAPKAQIRGKVQSITDHVGHELDFNYYYDGNLRQIVEKGGGLLPDRKFTFTYTTSDGSGPAIADAASRQDPDPSTNNESTRLYSVIDPRGNETTFSYITSGQDKWKLASSTDRLGNQTTYSYDDTNQKTTVNLPLSRSWAYAYNAGGQVTAITNPLAQTTTVTWSPDLEVSSVTEPAGAKTSFTYNDNGYVTSTTDANNHTTQLTYQNTAVDGNDVSGKWASGRTIAHISDLATKTEPLGVGATGYKWTYGYDGKGNLLTVTDPLGNVTHNTYNADGTLATNSDADGHPATQFENYDANGLPQTVIDPRNDKTQFTYDAAGRVTAIQDPEHSDFTDPSTTIKYQTQYVYDAFGRLIQESMPKSSTFEDGVIIWTDYSYDANDNTLSVTNPHYGSTADDVSGVATTSFTYDAMDRQTEKKTIDPSDSPDANGARTQTSYDAAGRVTKVVEPLGLVSGAVANSYTTTYTYDALDRMATTSQYDADGTTARVTHTCYDLAGDLRSVTLPRGSATFTGCPQASSGYTLSTDPFTWTYTYDPTHQLISQSDPLGHKSSVTFDANDNVKTSTDENGSTTTYSYDQRDLLTQVTQPFDTSVSPERDLVTKYDYDGVGNITRIISPRAYDASPDKSTFTDYVTSYHYDNANELVRTDLPADAHTTATYEYRCYDKDGRLKVVTLPVTAALDPSTLNDCSTIDDQHNATVDMAHKTLVYYFDPGWIRAINDPADPLVYFGYTAEGWQNDRLPTNSAGDRDHAHEQQWTYDPLGLVTKEIDPAASDGTTPTSTYSYDANGRNVKTTESGVYDTTAGDGPLSIETSYDGFGDTTRIASQKSGATDGRWNVTRYGYDLEGNVASRIDNQIEDEQGGTIYTAGDTQTFTYDGADRMQTQIDANLNRRITETFLPTGWQQSQLIEKQASDGSYATKQKTTWTYFANGLLKSLQTVNGANTVLESHDEQYVDSNNVFMDGNVVKDHFTMDGPNLACTPSSPCDATYGYDAQDRLTSYDNGHGGTEAYGLDPAGDITSLKSTIDGVTSEQDYTYNGTQLATQGDASGNVQQRYWYTDLGELLCVTTAAGTKADCPATRVSSLGSNVLQSYVYDPMRRLSDVQTAGSSTPLDTHYTYDALGRVTTEAEKQPTFSRSTNLTYLGISNQISQEGQTTTIGTASPTTSSTTFGYDAYGIRTEMTNTGGVRPGTYGYGYDARGDVSMLIGQSGTDGNTAVATYGYDPYGVPDTKLTQGDTGAITPTNPSGATINPFGFEGRFTDPGSNTVDMGARRWGPQTMHFLEEDQFAGSLDDLSLSTDPLNDNRYDLAGGNPINFVETDGHRVAPTSAACVRTGQIYCTLSAFRRSSWSDRLSWLLKIGNKYAGQWLNAFDGIVTYFKESKVLSNSSRVKAADADVLWVIGRGLRADVGGNTFKVKPWTPVPLGYVLTHGVPRGAQTAVDDWASFFLGLGTPGIKDSQLKKLWGRAEFAGVHFAEHDTRNMPIGKFQYSVYQGFIKIGDVYRLALEKGTELKYHFSICGIIPYTVTRNPDPRYDAQWLAEKAMEYELYRRSPCG